METMSRHPNRDNVRFVTQDRSAGTSSSSLRSPAWTEDDKDSVVDNPQSDLELAIPIERKHSAPVQHMWWYEDDDDQSSSLFSSSAGDGPSFISSDGCEETRKVASEKKASKENTGAQTVAQGQMEHDGAVAHLQAEGSRIWERDLQAVAHLLGSESGSVCQQERAEKPTKPKKPELHQRTRQEDKVRESVITSIFTALRNSPGPDNSDNDDEQVQLQKQQGKADVDLSHLTALSREELMSVVSLSEEGRPTTIGSILHATRAYKPCVFTTGSTNCSQGAYCRDCHLHHNSKSRNARRILGFKKRQSLRKQVVCLCKQVESDLSLDLDTFEIPSSLFHWADVIKTNLRSYQQGLRTQQPKLSL